MLNMQHINWILREINIRPMPSMEPQALRGALQAQAQVEDALRKQAASLAEPEPATEETDGSRDRESSPESK